MSPDRVFSNPLTFEKRLMRNALAIVIAGGLVLTISGNSRGADCDFERRFRIGIAGGAPPKSSETISISFVTCESDPIDKCGVPIAGGCPQSACIATVNCSQPSFEHMTFSVVDAINSMGCPGISAAVFGNPADGAVDVFCPSSMCLCITDSTSSQGYPFSPHCGFVPLCENAWFFGFALGCPVAPETFCIDLGDFGPNIQ